jgi:hypothetical protein
MNKFLITIIAFVVVTVVGLAVIFTTSDSLESVMSKIGLKDRNGLLTDSNQSHEEIGQQMNDLASGNLTGAYQSFDRADGHQGFLKYEDFYIPENTCADDTDVSDLAGKLPAVDTAPAPR